MITSAACTVKGFTHGGGGIRITFTVGLAGRWLVICGAKDVRTNQMGWR